MKKSILLFEYAIVEIKNGHGISPHGRARKRARPIVMKTVAMSAGMAPGLAPIALGIGAGAESRVPMGVPPRPDLIDTAQSDLRSRCLHLHRRPGAVA
ncbi:hypothetical protein [Rhizobium sp. MHM7A]|uniref:hypothetical protein n=1 Tax=Rhizobium sp. MHM7A TaxID=2583233 RepID=UPI0032B27084